LFSALPAGRRIEDRVDPADRQLVGATFGRRVLAEQLIEISPRDLVVPQGVDQALGADGLRQSDPGDVTGQPGSYE
jgi:hypothetical protein